MVLYASANNPGAAEVAASLNEALPLLKVQDGTEAKPTHMLLYLNKETFVGEAGAELAREVRHHLIAPVTPRATARQVAKQAILCLIQAEALSKQSSASEEASVNAVIHVIKLSLQKGEPSQAPVADAHQPPSPKSNWKRARKVMMKKQVQLPNQGQRLPLLMIHENDPGAGGYEFTRFFEVTPKYLIAGGMYRTLAYALQPGAFRPVSVALIAQAAGALDSQPMSQPLRVKLACGLLSNRGQQIEASDKSFSMTSWEAGKTSWATI